MNIDYQKEVRESVLKEYDEFTKKMLTKTSFEVFNNCYKIYFLNVMSDYFEDNDLSDEIYCPLYNLRGSILIELFNHSISSEYDVSNYDDIEKYIIEYIGKNYQNENVNEFENNLNSLDTNIDYRVEIQKSVNSEFDFFKQEQLKKSNEEIFDNSGKIEFYQNINDFFENILDDESFYVTLYKNKANIIHNLWSFYIDNEAYNTTTYGDINDMLVDYINKQNEYSDEKEMGG